MSQWDPGAEEPEAPSAAVLVPVRLDPLSLPIEGLMVETGVIDASLVPRPLVPTMLIWCPLIAVALIGPPLIPLPLIGSSPIATVSPLVALAVLHPALTRVRRRRTQSDS
jgi:hypothetical protein